MHIGSWGTPDLGITEKIQSIFTPNKAYASSGGSNLFGPVSAPAQTTNQSSAIYGPTYSGPQSNYGPTYSGSQSSGQVLGANTVNQPSGGGGGTPEVDFGEYYNQLDQMLAGLEPSKTAMESSALSQKEQSLADVGLQQQQGMNLLGGQRTETTTNQSKTLRDLAENLKNSMLAGSIYLGARGAGDSSAANMYSYALTKLGNKQRGDIMGQTSDILAKIGERESNIKSVYDNEVNRVKSVFNQAINNIAQWFSTAQQNIRGMKAEGAKEKSQMAYNYAISQLQTAQQDNANKQAMLNEWATNNLKDINQVKAQMKENANYYPIFPKAQQIAGQPITDTSGNVNVQAPAGYNYGSSTEDKYDIYGNRIG